MSANTTQALKPLDGETFFAAVTNPIHDSSFHELLRHLVGHKDILRTLCKIDENEIYCMDNNTGMKVPNYMACDRLAKKLSNTLGQVLSSSYGESCVPRLKLAKRSLRAVLELAIKDLGQESAQGEFACAILWEQRAHRFSDDDDSDDDDSDDAPNMSRGAGSKRPRDPQPSGTA